MQFRLNRRRLLKDPGHHLEHPLRVLLLLGNVLELHFHETLETWTGPLRKAAHCCVHRSRVYNLELCSRVHRLEGSRALKLEHPQISCPSALPHDSGAHNSISQPPRRVVPGDNKAGMTLHGLQELDAVECFFLVHVLPAKNLPDMFWGKVRGVYILRSRTPSESGPSTPAQLSWYAINHFLGASFPKP